MAVVKLFVSYPKLYSWPYIAYMRSELSETGAMRIDNTKCFLDLLNHSAVSFAENDILRLSKQFYELKGDLNSITFVGNKILAAISLKMNFLLSYTEVGILTKEIDLLVKYIKEGKEPVTVEIFIGLAKLQQESERQRLEDTKRMGELIEKERTDKIAEEELQKQRKRHEVTTMLGKSLRTEK